MVAAERDRSLRRDPDGFLAPNRSELRAEPSGPLWSTGAGEATSDRGGSDMLAAGPNWAEQLTAIATAAGALGLLGAIGAAVFAGQQVREARQSRQAQMAGDLVRRWSEPDLVETRRLVAQFPTPDDLRRALQGYIARNDVEAY